MPPKMGLRVSSCFHNAFSAVDCQEISGRFWPDSDDPAASHIAREAGRQAPGTFALFCSENLSIIGHAKNKEQSLQ